MIRVVIFYIHLFVVLGFLWFMGDVVLNLNNFDIFKFLPIWVGASVVFALDQ